ncbi:gliding motility-associated C-terminal domain-containing protein [Flavobacterium sp. MDT1-60]|uniref:gliding motility-associated C-terminal domain-containing protein n=1 Tax=Flavobacterium sp. MDT1-60 TaxID=1979344 RepID=UPI00178110B4|nr:gliding motility-associated C-terminal domain-containing protein [Flavobacterium sp. MDT1-60]QOG00557.1 gliding motility-associated C-terminal domain-containing protein [Flavobacterium sp. MDT1-60]
MIKDLQQFQFVLKNRKDLSCIFSFIAILLLSQKGQAQFINQGDLKVSGNTILSVYMNYDNKITGNFVNDGQVHAFENYNNDGSISYTDKSSGTTFFTGEQEQIIAGSQVSDFQNVVFNNVTSLMPFQLKTAVKVGKNADFKNGIVNAGEYSSRMIFDTEASFTNAGNQSFVDGEVQKKGNAMFEFPVGNQLYYRPAISGVTSDLKNAFTTQYFYQNSNALYPHSQKEETILSINDSEYWKVTQDSGNEKIVLSLTLNDKTTPSEFFNIPPNTKLAIVRWDDILQKWTNCNGESSDPTQTLNYEKLLTAQVTGYGIFTMAIVKEIIIDEKLIVYNAVSPNGDGINDSFHIKEIDKYPDNMVEIYNRWGVKVFETKSYNESDNMFRGYSDGRATINRGEKLPTGTYFYILKYNNTKKVVEQSGYLYINNQ